MAIKVLFCGAHPDDAEIYSFGTLFAYAAAKAEIMLALATAGEGGLTARSQHQPLATTRMQEAQKAAEMLGAQLVLLSFIDGGLAMQRSELLSKLSLLIAQFRPDVIMTHSLTDYHPDHRTLSAAVSLAAVDMATVFYVDNMKGLHFRPTHFVDIGKYQSKKMLALRCHQSQKPRRYVLAATALAAARGFAATGRSDVMMEALHIQTRTPDHRLAHLLPPRTIAAPDVLFRTPDVTES